MRLIYIDETGRANEPLAVVCGIVVHESQCRGVLDAIDATLAEFVPPDLLNGFVYHTKDLIGNTHDAVWPFQRRLQLIHRMMAMPASLGLPIVAGFAAKEKMVSDNPDGLSINHLAHAQAFWACVGTATWYLRKRTAGDVGKVIAEETDSVKDAINRSVDLIRERPTLIKPVAELFAGSTESVLFSTRELVGPITWAPKATPLLWLADACAYGLRRYFSGNKHGDGYIDSIAGSGKAYAKGAIEGLKTYGVGQMYLERPPPSYQVVTYSISS